MFFNEDGILDIDALMVENMSFKRIMEDGSVAPEELQAESDKVVGILRHMQATYDDEQLAEVKELLVEISALFAAYNVYSIQEIDKI